jgi:hypothetical protein
VPYTFTIAPNEWRVYLTSGNPLSVGEARDRLVPGARFVRGDHRFLQDAFSDDNALLILEPAVGPIPATLE